MLRTADLEYELPSDRIATHPVTPRDSARLMVLRRDGSGQAEDLHVRDLVGVLRPYDLLVLNTTRVLPARFLGMREDTAAKVQGLYLGPAYESQGLSVPPTAAVSNRCVEGKISEGDTDRAEPRSVARVWRVLLKMRRFREGTRVRLFDRSGNPSDVVLGLVSRAAAAGPDGAEAGWIVAVDSPEAPGTPDSVVLERVGLAPLPPYILASRKKEAEAPVDSRDDLEKYQTVYADPAQASSVAAPTAGLHFTPALLRALAEMGVSTASVVLHVGLGTFKPVETEFVEQHPMHAEWCVLPAATARAIAETRARGGRVVAVGTTAARTLESFADVAAITDDAATSTRILITPGYRFRHVDALMTNFHLPRSTLMAMVAAFLGERDGLARLLAAYREAVQMGYRFYSYGDAMVIM